MKTKAQEINEPGVRDEVLRATQPVLVGFLTGWSKPCRLIEPVLDEVAEASNGNAKIFKVNVDDNPDLGNFVWDSIGSRPDLFRQRGGSRKNCRHGQPQGGSGQIEFAHAGKHSNKGNLNGGIASKSNRTWKQDMKTELQSKPGGNVRLFVPSRWTFTRIVAVRLAKQGARILANLGRFRRITARMETSFRALKVDGRWPGRQPVLRQVDALEEQTFWPRTPRANTDPRIFLNKISSESRVAKNEN